jgi:Grx4 family monothiol glutaredoxin
MSLYDITAIEQITELQAKNKKCILFFWAAWQEASKLGGPLQSVFQALSQKHGESSKSPVLFLRVEAENVPECSEKYGITVVPSFIAVNGNNVVDRLEGANPKDLSKLVAQLQSAGPDTVFKAVESAAAAATTTAQAPAAVSAAAPKAEPEAEPVNTEELVARIKSIIGQSPVVLFMKGEPTAPRCGFSRQMCEILRENQVEFSHFDILTDQDIRSQLKLYSDWPTYPQLYVNGEFTGGLDIIKEIKAGAGEDKGEFRAQIGL